MAESGVDNNKQSIALKWYYEHKEDPEFLEKKRTKDLEYYYKRKLDINFVEKQKLKALNRYHEKMKDLSWISISLLVLEILFQLILTINFTLMINYY